MKSFGIAAENGVRPPLTISLSNFSKMDTRLNGGGTASSL